MFIVGFSKPLFQKIRNSVTNFAEINSGQVLKAMENISIETFGFCGLTEGGVFVVQTQRQARLSNFNSY